MRNYNDETTWAQMIKDREDMEKHLHEGELIVKEMIKEIEGLKRDNALLKEQIRVADVAHDYLTKRCRELELANERANKLVESEANKRERLEHVLRNGGINPETL